MKRRWIVLATFAVLALLVWALLSLPSWFWHPLGLCTGTHAQVVGCKGYNSWSGSFSDIGEITLVGLAISGMVAIVRFYLKHLTCHVTVCKKPALHHVPGTPFRTCKDHHPEIPDGEITVEHIHQRHRAAKA